MNAKQVKISRLVITKIREYAAQDSIVSKWENSVYGEIQKITNPKKGVLGEDLVRAWLDDLGYLAENHGYNRQRGGGNFDLLVLIDNQLEKIEVKLATEDSSGKYQINWIPIEPNVVALVVFVCISPDAVYLGVKPHDELLSWVANPTPGKTLTAVPPNNPTHRKWTTSASNAGLAEIVTLDDVKEVFDEAINRFIAGKRK